MRLSGGLHAYIVTGRSEDRERLAFRLAEEALCSAENAPCGVCSDCRKSMARAHPDLHEISPDGAAIKVDQVRDDVRTIAQIKPNEAARHAFVIHEADKLNTAAQNALLAVIEEPPTPCIFIFVCENERTLLATIRSRCGVLRANTSNIEDDASADDAALPVPDANLIAAFCGRARTAADVAEATSPLAKLKGDEASRLLESVRAALVRAALRGMDGSVGRAPSGASPADAALRGADLAAKAQDMLRANVSAAQVAAWLVVELT